MAGPAESSELATMFPPPRVAPEQSGENEDFVRRISLQSEFQHSIGSELRPTLRGDEAGQMLGIYSRVLTEFK